MEDLFPKFIIETDDELGDCLIIGKCTYHRELAIIKENVKGGGWYKYNNETNTFTLYGESEDFGPAEIEDIQNVINNDNVYTNPYLSHPITKKHKFIYDAYSEKIKLN